MCLVEYKHRVSPADPLERFPVLLVDQIIVWHEQDLGPRRHKLPRQVIRARPDLAPYGDQVLDVERLRAEVGVPVQERLDLDVVTAAARLRDNDIPFYLQSVLKILGLNETRSEIYGRAWRPAPS